MCEGLWYDHATALETPAWITDDITPYDLTSINVYGCESGAYRPAAIPELAEKTMAEHGKDVLDFIRDRCGKLPEPPTSLSWGEMAAFYLSHAVERWAYETAITI